MYSSLAEFKTYLWISWTEQDAELTMYLNSANELLNKLLNVDTFSEWTIEEQVKIITENRYWNNVNLYLKNRPVQQIQEIDWVEYQWVAGTDYLVVYDRKVIFKDRTILSKINDFWFIKVKYKFWYSVQNMPSDLKLMEMMLASGMNNSKWYEWVYSYKLWDETIQFWHVNWTSADDIFFSFKTLYNKRKSFILPC